MCADICNCVLPQYDPHGGLGHKNQSSSFVSVHEGVCACIHVLFTAKGRWMSVLEDTRKCSTI